MASGCSDSELGGDAGGGDAGLGDAAGLGPLGDGDEVEASLAPLDLPLLALLWEIIFCGPILVVVMMNNVVIR